MYACGNSSDLNTLTITHGTLTDNFSTGKGGAIYATTNSVNISGSILDANYARNEGGAVYINTTSSLEPILTADNSSFVGNWAEYGGAISNGLSSGVHLDVPGDTSFIGNFAYDQGGAIYLSGAYIDELSANFQGNFGNWEAGGAISLNNLLDTSVTINNSSFTDNTAGDDLGGALAIFSENTDVAITGSTTFTGNSALYDDSGGAIYDDGHSLTLTGTTFNNNTSWSGTGGAIYVQNGDLTMTNAAFNDNVAMNTNAGAIDYESNGVISVANSTFNNNQAIYGGSGAFQQGESTDHAVITNSRFINNMAYDGSVGAWRQYTGDLTITDSLFRGNSATNEVGGIQQDTGNLTITGTTFDHNSSVGYAGALYDHQSDSNTTTIKNSTFYRNYAPWDEAGAYYHDGGSSANINNATFDENLSSTDGGNAFTVYSSPTVITNSIFAGSPFGSCTEYDGGIDRVNSTNNIDDGSICFDSEANNQNNVNPETIFSTAGLADNGGRTATVALADNSPAIDAGNDATCETTDQTGAARPHGSHCDIGAVEASTSTPVPTLTQVTQIPSMVTAGSSAVYRFSVSGDTTGYSYLVGECNATAVVDSTAHTVTLSGAGMATGSYHRCTIKLHSNSHDSNELTIGPFSVIAEVSAGVSGGGGGGGGAWTLPASNKIPTTSNGNTPSGKNSGNNYHFPRNQKSGIAGGDVIILQQFLNSHGFIISTSGPGSKGNETKLFGSKTKTALIKYQKSKGLTPDGVLGPKTRTVIESDM